MPGDLEAAGRRHIGDLDIDFLVVQFVGAQLLAEAIARRRRGGGADQRIEHPLLGIQMRLRLDLGALLFAHEADADFDEIADDLFDVAADIADFGELRRLDLDERGAGQLGETAGNFRLADAGRPDHQDVLRHHLVAQLVGELLAAPAVAKRDGDSALGIVLADDEPVELRHDFAG